MPIVCIIFLSNSSQTSERATKREREGESGPASERKSERENNRTREREQKSERARESVRESGRPTDRAREHEGKRAREREVNPQTERTKMRDSEKGRNSESQRLGKQANTKRKRERASDAETASEKFRICPSFLIPTSADRDHRASSVQIPSVILLLIRFLACHFR